MTRYGSRGQGDSGQVERMNYKKTLVEPSASILLELHFFFLIRVESIPDPLTVIDTRVEKGTVGAICL